MKAFLSGLLFSAMLATWASSGFRYVNLLEGEQSVFRKIPVYSQGGMGTCYAYAVSQFVDYHRIQRGEKIASNDDLTSVTWVALLHSKKSLISEAIRESEIWDEELNPLDVGFPGIAIRELGKAGICTRGQLMKITRELESELSSSGVQLDPEQVTNFVDRLMEDYYSLLAASIQAVRDGKRLVDFGNPSVSLPKIYPRPMLSEKAFKPLELGPLELPNPAPIDNTYVARRPVLLVKPSPSPTAVATTTAATTAPAPATASAPTTTPLFPFGLTIPSPSPRPSYDPKLYSDLKRQIPVARDNTYVAKSASAMRAEFEFARLDALAALEARYRGYRDSRNRGVIALLELARRHEGGIFGLFHDWFMPCEAIAKKIEFPRVKSFVSVVSARDGFHRVIGSRLTAKSPQPVIVAYYASVLTKGKAPGSLFESSGHVSLIVGQRKVAGKVQYLIQNSWGTSCSGYSSKWECLNGQGAVWVDGETLRDSALKLYWF